MPKGVPHVIEYQGLPMSLAEFAETVGIPRKTVQSRWNRGDRTVEQLGRPSDQRFNYPRGTSKAGVCRSSLLAGWKSAIGASEAQTVTTPSAKSS